MHNLCKTLECKFGAVGEKSDLGLKLFTEMKPPLFFLA